jgi:hypothetical protein
MSTGAHPWIGQYILDDDGTPVPEPDLLKWGLWLQTHDRHVAEDLLPGDVRVSTLFLGLDQAFFWGGPPLLWETMTFGPEGIQYQERYKTRAEAEAGHARALELAKQHTEDSAK